MTKPVEQPRRRPHPAPETTNSNPLRAEHAAQSVNERTLPTLFGFGGISRGILVDVVENPDLFPKSADHRES
jgi:hypothetical protein